MPLLLRLRGRAPIAYEFNDIYVAAFLVFLAIRTSSLDHIEEHSGFDSLSSDFSIPSLFGRSEMAHLMPLAIEN